jgi:hypothetical protein
LPSPLEYFKALDSQQDLFGSNPLNNRNRQPAATIEKLNLLARPNPADRTQMMCLGTVKLNGTLNYSITVESM